MGLYFRGWRHLLDRQPTVYGTTLWLQTESHTDSVAIFLTQRSLDPSVVDNLPLPRYYSPIMGSDRVQRQLDRLLDGAEQASFPSTTHPTSFANGR